MKRILALLLTVFLALQCCLPAFAEEAAAPVETAPAETAPCTVIGCACKAPENQKNIPKRINNRFILSY